MPKKPIVTPAGKPVAAYSLAIEAGDTVYISGQIGLDAATGKLVDGGTAAQAEQAMENAKAILRAAGLSFAHVVKATVFLVDIGDFAAVNDVYKGYFSEPYPARSMLAVAALPLGAKVEIEMIASRSAV